MGSGGGDPRCIGGCEMGKQVGNIDIHCRNDWYRDKVSSNTLVGNALDGRERQTTRQHSFCNTFDISGADQVQFCKRVICEYVGHRRDRSKEQTHTIVGGALTADVV